MSAAWSQRCKTVLGKQMFSLHTMVAYWASKLAFWLQASNLSVQRAVVSPLLRNVRLWLERGSVASHWYVPKGQHNVLSMM